MSRSWWPARSTLKDFARSSASARAFDDGFLIVIALIDLTAEDE
jgi:hypothetical protein